MIISPPSFHNWRWYEASEDERALWERVGTMLYEYFEDMLFRKGTITESFAKVQVSATKADIHSDEYLDGPWIDEILTFPDEIEYFSADSVRVKITDLPHAMGMFHVRREDDVLEIVIDEKYKDDDTVIAHELIHLHEYLLEEYAPYAKDIVFWALYQNLKTKINNLDQIISRHLLLLNTRDINLGGGKHDLLFLIKSLDMDLRLKKEFGTVYGYEQREFFQSI